MSTLVCITGTESTGKTTLAIKLAEQFNARLVPDVARHYINGLNRPYQQDDVLEIARQIIQQEDAALQEGHPLVITDNDLINIKIWLNYYSWPVPAWLETAIAQRVHPLYLLCYIDVPWQRDEQRQNPHDREALYRRFKVGLSALKANFNILKGSELQRLTQAGEAIKKIL